MPWRNILITVTTVAVLAIAGLALRHLLDGIAWEDVARAVHAIPTHALLASAALTTLSYVVLTGFDVLALRLVGRPVPYPITALAAFTSYIFSHNFGFAALTGGTARYRIYGRHGVSLGDVGQIMVVAGVTFWLGAFLLLALAFVILPHAPPIAGHVLPPALRSWAGLATLVLLGGYMIALAILKGRTIRLWRWEVRLPTWRMAGAQFALGTLDMLVATAALFVLLPSPDPALYPAVLVGYLVAIISSLLVHAPGGLGVFEAVMIAALPQVDRATLVAALLTFRLIYYLIPLGIGVLLFAGHEVVVLRRARAA